MCAQRSAMKQGSKGPSMSRDNFKLIAAASFLSEALRSAGCSRGLCWAIYWGHTTQAWTHRDSINWISVAVGVASIAVYFVLRRYNSHLKSSGVTNFFLPEALLVVGIFTFFSWAGEPSRVTPVLCLDGIVGTPDRRCPLKLTRRVMAVQASIMKLWQLCSQPRFLSDHAATLRL